MNPFQAYIRFQPPNHPRASPSLPEQSAERKAGAKRQSAESGALYRPFRART
jgi:hypothetical protein